MIEQIRKQPQGLVQTINWRSDDASAETFHAMPLIGRNNELPGVLLVGSSRLELVLLRNRIIAVAGLLVLTVLMTLWIGPKRTRVC